jgi:hypothetical protein
LGNTPPAVKRGSICRDGFHQLFGFRIRVRNQVGVPLAAPSIFCCLSTLAA